MEMKKNHVYCIFYIRREPLVQKVFHRRVHHRLHLLVLVQVVLVLVVNQNLPVVILQNQIRKKNSLLRNLNK